MIEPINLWTLICNKEGHDYSTLHKALDALLSENQLDLQDVYCFPFDYKDRFESIAGCLKKMLDSSNVGKQLKIEEPLTIEVQRITSVLCYLLNSNSLRTGKYQQYDKDEVSRKLGRK